MKIRSLKSAFPFVVAASALMVAAQPAQAGLVFGNGPVASGGCDPFCSVLDIQNSAGGYLDIGNVRYANWSALFTSLGPGGVLGLDAAAGVFVSPLNASGANGFQLTYGLNPSLNTRDDLKLQYSAQTLDGSNIDSVTAALSSVSASGTGTAGVLETVYADGFGLGASLATIAATIPPNAQGDSFTQALSNPDDLVYVIKDISATSGPTGSDAAFNSGIFNTHTTADPIPTPALLPGLLGFGATILRKRKQSTQAA